MHLIAARGVESSGTQLPHLDKIQASFGPAHEISSVQAHVGGAAADAATSIGARAYATGDHVAFVNEPDLHTAAHEAAHTVQQRDGVQLEGGVGEVGDPYEQHADAVADKVVAGESAASLLDEMAGGGRGVRQQAIQRAPVTAGVPVRTDDAADRAYEQYLGAHWDQLREAARRHFTDHLGHWNVARLDWAVDGQRRAAAIADAIFPTLHITGQLESLVAPEPLGPALALGLATMQRPGEGDGDPSWNPAVGIAVARLLERRLAESMERMGERYVKAYDRNGGAVDASDLPRGDAMDRVAAALLTDGLVRVMGPLPERRREHAPKKPKAWRWLGARDAGLWNWIEVTDPRDADLADVSLLLPADVPPIVEGDGRFFRMPEEWARTQAGAAEHAPSAGAVATGVELASSSFAIDAAIAQADDLPKARKQESAADVDARIERIVGAIHQVVAMLGDEYGERIVPAFVALGAARNQAGERGQRADIARVLIGQEALLEEILQEIDLFHRTSFGRGRPRNAGPMEAAYIELALAAGNSHLHDVGRRHLATARAKAADVGRRLAEEAAVANGAGVARVAEGGGEGVDDARERQRDRFDRLDSNAPDPGTMDLEASLDAFLLHTQSVVDQLDRMVSALYATNERLASILGLPWVVEAEALAHSVAVVRDKAQHVRRWLLERLAETSAAPARQTLLERAKATLAEEIAASQLIDISRRVVAMLRRVDEVDGIIKMINQTVTMIGISVIASGAGMLVAGALTPSATSVTAGAGVVTLGRVGATAAGIVTEGLVGGWLQAELLGDNAGEAIAENMLASLLTVAALRGFHGVTQRFGPFSAENIALWERLGGTGAGMVLRTTHLTLEMALGAGAGYAAQNIVRSPVKPTDDEALQWAMQGASIVVGHWITRRMAEAHTRLEGARPRISPDAVPRLEQTLKDIDALGARAAAAADNPIDQPAVLELFAEQHRVLAAEAAVAWATGADAASRAEPVQPDGDPNGRTGDGDTAYAETYLTLAGLEQVTPGRWNGSEADVQRVVTQARKAGLSVAEHRGADNGRRWSVKSGGREHTVEVHASEVAELARIRNGPDGRIRGESELNNADVAHALNAQLARVEAGDVDEIIASFPASQRAQARVVLGRASGFGNIESLTALRVAMDPHLANGRSLFMPGSGSLADNIAYVAGKGVFTGEPGVSTAALNVTGEILPRSLVILDDVVLHRIQTDPNFAQSLIGNDCILLEPVGFVSGINMYNGGSPEQIAERAARLLARAQEIQRGVGGKMDFDEAVEHALREGTHAVLKGADKGLLGQVRTVDAAHHDQVSSAAISEQLSGKAGLTAEVLDDAFESVALSPEQRAYARELLARQGDVFSARRQANELERHHQQIMSDLAARGVTADNSYFYIPEGGKSFGMIAMAHRQSTGAALDRYINGPSELAARGLGPESVIVVFDDVSGSGATLRDAVVAVGKTSFRGRVIAAPMVSTERAQAVFENPSHGLAAHRDDLEYTPGRMSGSLTESKFYKSLNAAQRAKMDAVIDETGFGGNALTMAFPYMAPDNNNSFFGDVLAKFFIMNQKRTPSKSLPYTPPNPASGNP